MIYSRLKFTVVYRKPRRSYSIYDNISSFGVDLFTFVCYIISLPQSNINAYHNASLHKLYVSFLSFLYCIHIWIIRVYVRINTLYIYKASKLSMSTNVYLSNEYTSCLPLMIKFDSLLLCRQRWRRVSTWQNEFIPGPEQTRWQHNPDSKVHGANMGPTWVISAPDGPHVGPMNLAIR